MLLLHYIYIYSSLSANLPWLYLNLPLHTHRTTDHVTRSSAPWLVVTSVIHYSFFYIFTTDRMWSDPWNRLPDQRHVPFGRCHFALQHNSPFRAEIRQGTSRYSEWGAPRRQHGGGPHNATTLGASSARCRFDVTVWRNAWRHSPTPSSPCYSSWNRMRAIVTRNIDSVFSWLHHFIFVTQSVTTIGNRWLQNHVVIDKYSRHLNILRITTNGWTPIA